MHKLVKKTEGILGVNKLTRKFKGTILWLSNEHLWMENKIVFHPTCWFSCAPYHIEKPL
jgi:hypothetical protein